MTSLDPLAVSPTGPFVLGPIGPGAVNALLAARQAVRLPVLSQPKGSCQGTADRIFGGEVDQSRVWRATG